MSENDISRDGEPRSSKLDRKLLLIMVGLCVGFVLLIALNMN